MKKLFILILVVFTITGCATKVSTFISDEDKEYLKLEGDIQNQIISATSTVAAKIIEMNKQQGEPVKKGEIIAVIDHSNQKYAVEQLQAVVKMKQAKLEELKEGPRPQQIEQAKAQVRAAKAKIDLLNSGTNVEQIEQAKNNVAMAEESIKSAQLTFDQAETHYNRTLALYENGALSKVEMEKAKYSLDTTTEKLSTLEYQLENAKQQLTLLEKGPKQAEIDAAQANYDAANAQLKLLQSGVTDQTIRAAEADVEQSMAQLNQAKHNLNNCNIIALEDGIIISKNYELGDIVNVGGNIADIAVSEGVYVLTYIPTEYLEKIYYNQSLPVKTSIGEQTGKVSYIDLEDEYTPSDERSTSEGNNMTTKIKVAIDDKGGKLKSGMKATVNIPLHD